MGLREQDDMQAKKGDCGCGGLGPDCADKQTTSMGGPFTSGIGTGAGIAIGIIGAGWLLSLVLGKKD